MRAQQSAEQQGRCKQEQFIRADSLRKCRRQPWAQDCAQAPAGSDYAKQAFSPVPAEQVSHQAPENGKHEQVVDTDPNIKGLGRQQVLALQQRVEHQQAGNKKTGKHRAPADAGASGCWPSQTAAPQPAITRKVALNSHCNRSTPARMPISSRNGRSR